MENLYQDIATRTGGDIYIGVVGPVRTGKSTFIKRFMNELVIPNMKDPFKKERAVDELPQSAAGRTIMTTEPKFIPNEAVKVGLNDNLNFNVRLIDCVGYVVNSAMGHTEEGSDRMVNTPWSDEPIPFIKAAEIGTKKVICEHSTIGLVVTTDGSITEIPREDYIEAEERVVSELKAIDKPFVMLLNSTKPNDIETQKLKVELEEKYKVSVVATDCEKLNHKDIGEILEHVLLEFPVHEIKIDFPSWVDSLKDNHWLSAELLNYVKRGIDNVAKIREVKEIRDALLCSERVEKAEIVSMDLGHGTVCLNASVPENLFYKILGETSGFEIEGQENLISLMQELAEIKREYDKIASALQEVKQKGYGIVSPTIDELSLEEPEIMKQGGRFGIRLRASAPSIHMIAATVETEVNPIVGTEKQSEELIHYLLNEFDTDPKKIWESNIFGKSLHDLVNEGLHNKLYRMPDDAQFKLQETLQKIINEGSGGLICIIL